MRQPVCGWIKRTIKTFTFDITIHKPQQYSPSILEILSTMKTASCPKWFFAATAAFVAGPASSLLHSEQRHVARQTLARPSFLKLDASANRHKFTELEKLKAKRLSIRRRRVPEEFKVDKLEVSSNGEEDLHMRSQVPDDDNSDTYHATIGLEYLYEVGQERHSDDLFHIILLPS